MSDGQKKVAALVAMLFLAIPALILIFFAIVSNGSDTLGDKFPGNFMMAVAADGDAGQTAFKLAPVIVSFGLSLLVPKDKADWRFISTVGLAVTGTIAAGYLYFSLQGAGLSHRLWSYTDIESMASPEAIKARLRPTLLLFVGWFLGLLAVQLGVKFSGGSNSG